MRRAFALVSCCLLMLALATTAGGASSHSISGDHGLFLSILPAGQGSSLTALSGNPPPHSEDQLDMYRNLPTAVPISGSDLTSYFKSEQFGVAPGDVERTENPAPGVVVKRDHFGVPHIYGNTRADAMFGAGYVTAEDRLFEADVLRHVGRGRLSEFLGPSDSNLAMDRAQYLVSGYSNDEMRTQIGKLLNEGPLGTQVVNDGQQFIRGLNARIQEDMANPSELPLEYPALQVQPAPWKVTDLVAVATLIQATFASGGGGELADGVFLQEATARYGATKARKLFDDLRTAEDPGAPVTADGSFPFNAPGTIDPKAVAVPDRGSVKNYDPISTKPAPRGMPRAAPTLSAEERLMALNPRAYLGRKLAGMGIDFPGSMSNWLAVTGRYSASGHPVAVMGPQVSYWSPEILMEMDIHAPGLDARGATFPGISLYVLLGRGPDFAWSATSGESDLVDVRAERLCNPKGGNPGLHSRSYVFNGSCVHMLIRRDMWLAKPTPGGPGQPEEVTATVLRTVHGPVFAFGKVAGRPVAYVQQRSTFFGELDSALPFVLLNSDRVTSAESFIHAMSKFTGSFNWLYVDSKDVGYFHSGLYPIRARGVDPSLPSWGTGKWEWRGFVPPAGHPQQIDPPKGWIDSWNNKPARKWESADDQWGWGDVHRVQMLSSRLAARVPQGGVTPTDMVNIMGDAATVDLRGQEVMPAVLQAIGSDPSLQQYLDIMQLWLDSGAHRIDRDGDGQYDDQAAVALMDAWWPKLTKSIFTATLTGLYEFIPLPLDDPNRTGHLGSSFQKGYYGDVLDAVKMALGQPVARPFKVLRCADGTEAGCRAALTQSLQDAVNELGPDPSKWDACESCETIQFQPVGLVNIPEIPWQNRPTFQQVVEVTAKQ